MDHDAQERLTRLTYPDGTAVDYVYNTMGKLTAIPGFVTAIDYAPTGQKTAFTFANGVQSTYGYDSRQRLAQLRSTRGTAVLQDLAYSYDGASNIVRIADRRPVKTPEDRSADYAYDDLYRLTQATAPAWSEGYRYDSIGNMTFKSDLGAMTYGAGSAGPHALTAAAGISYGYDANGNLAAKQGFAYGFDYRDRLTRVDRTGDGAVINYAYDSGFDRKRKTVTLGGQSQTTLYVDRYTELRGDRLIKQLYAGDRLVARVSVAPFRPSMLAGWNPPRTPLDLDVNPKDGVISLGELRASGANPALVEPGEAIDALRIYQLNREANPGLLPFATLAAALHEQGALPPPAESRTLFYLPDHLGSASAVMDSGGGLVEESVFYPYGKDRVRTGGYESEYRFTGKELDGETGLTYFGARYYDSLTASFISVDPMTFEGKPTAASDRTALPNYRYASSNPLALLDQKGFASVGSKEWNHELINSRSNDRPKFEAMKKEYKIWQQHGGPENAAQMAYNEEYLKGLNRTINFVQGVKGVADIFVHFGGALAGPMGQKIVTVYDAADSIVPAAVTCLQDGCSKEYVAREAAGIATNMFVDKVAGHLMDKYFPISVENGSIPLSKVTLENIGVSINLGRAQAEAAYTGGSLLVKEVFFGH
ncbi:RHS repeat-associated core domain-containing protein [uncultured Thiodictyon sp.]|uniref:RHS repeat domain-containing protein n=1 Tax=uncultured Thiodictyon sp. TaxID=1846217 RepID=UPI0025FD0033|nr:RHS repeat-associated core domain-containing protein [uncultured Thiodictyon sp.]